MINKDLLIAILSVNDNLFSVIDMLIENNYDSREEYFKTVLELSRITKDELRNTHSFNSGWLMYLSKKIPFSVLFVFYIVSQTQTGLILRNDAYARDHYYYNHYDNRKTFEQYITELQQIFGFMKYFGSLANIALGLVTFNKELFMTQTYEKLYIDKIASFIMGEFEKGSLSPEFIEYLLTYVS